MIPPGPVSKHYMNVSFRWDLNSWLTHVVADISYNLDRIGRLALMSSLTADFNFEWRCDTLVPGKLAPFTLRPKNVAALGYLYEIWHSASPNLLATVRDHKYDLLGKQDVSCECPAGHLVIAETAKSNLTGLVNLGLRREYVMTGCFAGTVVVESTPGMRTFEVSYQAPTAQIAESNATLVGVLIVLQRSIEERHH